MTENMLASILVRHHIIDLSAVEDADGYDAALTMLRVRTAAQEISEIVAQPAAVGMCNCGNFEPEYLKHDSCPDCNRPWRILSWLQALHYLHQIYEDEAKLKRYWRDKSEV